VNHAAIKVLNYAEKVLFWAFNAVVVAGAVAFVSVIVGFIGFAIWMKRDVAPDDRTMITNFHKNRAIFETLKDKICALPESQTVMMNPAWSRPIISDQIRDDYYQLLRIIDAKGIQSVRNKFGIDCSVAIEFWAKGWMVEADYKKYTFNDPAGKDDIVVESLDNLPLHPTEVQSFRRELIDGWALQYHHWP
jgi:hypothetical protein